MNVVNVHQRQLATSPERVGAVIDRIASRGDEPGPHAWPPIGVAVHAFWYHVCHRRSVRHSRVGRGIRAHASHAQEDG